jgi:hypothetical protein
MVVDCVAAKPPSSLRIVVHRQPCVERGQSASLHPYRAHLGRFLGARGVRIGATGDSWARKSRLGSAPGFHPTGVTATVQFRTLGGNTEAWNAFEPTENTNQPLGTRLDLGATYVRSEL